MHISTKSQSLPFDKSPPRSNVKWFSDKQKPKHRSPRQISALRLSDLARIFRHRYGTTLPDDDAGRDDIHVAINHMAGLAQPPRHIANWIELWAPWLTAAEQREMVGAALANPQYWKADNLAWRLRLTAKERRMLGVTTIGAVDENKAARTKRRKRLDRERKANARRAKGAKPRNDAQSISQAMPWLEEGISRRTWYRRRKAVGTAGTTSAAA
jgi:hypothetical protein